MHFPSFSPTNPSYPIFPSLEFLPGSSKPIPTSYRLNYNNPWIESETRKRIVPNLQDILKDHPEWMGSGDTWEINNPYTYHRYYLFASLSPLGRNLMMLVYRNIDNFLRGFNNPFEEHIVAFDRFMDDESAIRALGFRMGINIPVGGFQGEVDARGYFIDRLVEYITNMEELSPQESVFPDWELGKVGQWEMVKGLPTTREMMDMSFGEFKEFCKKHGVEPSELNYGDRLMVLMWVRRGGNM